MDQMDLFALLVCVIVAGLLVNRAMTLFSEANLSRRMEAFKKTYAATEARRNGARSERRTERDGEEAPPIPDWVPELLEQFGVDPEVLLEEEMPPDIKAFLPVVKGYVQAQGGIPGIMGQMKRGQQPSDSGTKTI